LGFAKVAMPGPLTWVHKPLPVTGSLAFKVNEKPHVDWSNPALATGAGGLKKLAAAEDVKKKNALTSVNKCFRITEFLVQ
jgi:hypothetical protein